MQLRRKGPSAGKGEIQFAPLGGCREMGRFQAPGDMRSPSAAYRKSFCSAEETSRGPGFQASGHPNAAPCFRHSLAGSPFGKPPNTPQPRSKGGHVTRAQPIQRWQPQAQRDWLGDRHMAQSRANEAQVRDIYREGPEEEEKEVLCRRPGSALQ